MPSFIMGEGQGEGANELPQERRIRMKAAVLEETKRMVLKDVKAPELYEGAVRVRPRFVGVCGTDKHVYRGEFHGRVTFPRILGHEFSGVVEEVSSSVPWLKPGAEVVVDPIVWCERCPACLEGRNNACAKLRLYGIDMDGGLCESIVVPASKIFPVPSGLSMREASVIELFAVACHATRKAGISPGDVVMVMGAGRLGLCLVNVLACTSASEVIAVDPVRSRLDLALSLGATRAVDPGQEDPVQVAKALTHDQGADKVIEAVGHAASIAGRENPIALAMAAVRHAGRVVVMGQGGEPVPVFWKPFVFKEAEVITSRVTQGEFPRALRLAQDGRIRPSAILTHHLPLDRVSEAFDLLDRGGPEVIKIVVEVPV